MPEELNPYAPPAAPSLDPPPKSTNPLQLKPAAKQLFIDPSGWATITSTLIALSILANLASVLLIALSISLLEQMAKGRPVGQAELEADSFRIVFAVICVAIFRYPSIIAFMFWTYRVAANLPALQAPRQEISPGWAVGYYFIPIVNLWMPGQALVEVWKGSDPARYQGDEIREQQFAIIWLWWCVYLLANMAAKVFRVASSAQPSIEDLITQNGIAIAVILLLEIPRDLLSLWIIRRLSKNQIARNEFVERTQELTTAS